MCMYDLRQHGQETKSVVPIICVNVTCKFAGSNCTKFRKADSIISDLYFEI